MPKIQDHSVHMLPTDLAENITCLGEARLARDQPLVKSSQPLARRAQRFIIPVQSQDLPIRTAVDQNLFAVPSPAQACRRDIACPAPGESNSTTSGTSTETCANTAQ